MTDPRAAAPSRGSSESAGRPTAGSLLRAAREAQGLDVAALAAAVKVPPRKVQALEADRHADLPDVAFTRGLARSLCRVLGIDPQPVLALLPVLPDIGPGLEQVHNGLNTPVREQLRLQSSSGVRIGALGRPAVWVPLVLLLGALALYVLPQGWIARTRAPSADAAATADASPAAGPAASAADPDAPPPALVETGPVYPPVAGAAVSAAMPVPPPAPPSVPPPAPLLRVDTTVDSWVEVTDATGAKLLYRTIRAGETVTLDGTPPLKVKVTNPKGVTLALRGQPVDLLPSTRGTMARLELK